MRIALREAAKGLGRTSPNPCVGAVIVKEGEILAKGYHKKAGTPHAEINALRKAGKKAAGGTMYVTLEPCNHTGRTPPCTEAILAAGINRVVIGMDDPNPSVAGKGGSYLQDKGVVVTSNILAERCRRLNYGFIKHITTGVPWVIMKAGVSLDGRIATHTGHSKWITCEKSRRQVHELRHRADAILVGIATVEADNPDLTARLPGKKGIDPLRVILDSELRIKPEARVLKHESGAPTWIFCRRNASAEKIEILKEQGAKVFKVATGEDGRLSLREILAKLGKEQITSVLVEGGGIVHASFLRQGLYDQAYIFVAPVFVGGDGTPLVQAMGVEKVDLAPHFITTRTRRFDNDVLIEGLFE